VPGALKKGKPGTPEFRAALRDGFETMGRTVFSHGVMNWTKDNHWGYTMETGVMLKVVNGDWKVFKMDVLRPTFGAVRFADAHPTPCDHATKRRPRLPTLVLLIKSFQGTFRLLMDASIASILLLDGITNGAIYALLRPGHGAGVLPSRASSSFRRVSLSPMARSLWRFFRRARCPAPCGCC
jgi:hypothetical protein